MIVCQLYPVLGKLVLDIDFDGENVSVHGKGFNGLTAPTETLDVEIVVQQLDL